MERFVRLILSPSSSSLRSDVSLCAPSFESIHLQHALLLLVVSGSNMSYYLRRRPGERDARQQLLLFHARV